MRIKEIVQVLKSLHQSVLGEGNLCLLLDLQQMIGYLRSMVYDSMLQHQLPLQHQSQTPTLCWENR